MRNKNRIIKEFKEFNELEKITTNRFVYYKSNPSLRSKIDKNGLIAKESKNSKINKPVIFLINSYEPYDWFESSYTDDIWKIDTHSIKNDFFKDPNFKWSDFKRVLTFNNIPRNSMVLYHKGINTIN